MSTTKPVSPNPKRIKSGAPISDSPLAAMTGSRSAAPRHHITVIVLSKNEPDLAVTLDLLRPQCEALGAECIVVDASNGRLESIRQDHEWTFWMDYRGPFWRSSTIPHQRNVGCRAAAGDILAFCDSGGEPDVNWLTSITAPLMSDTFSLVCGTVYAKRNGVHSFSNDVADSDVVSSASTANMAFLKSVFDEVNGFDERLFYGSDIDFVLRCADAQHPCYQVREACMLMDFGNLTRTMRRSWLHGRGWARLYSLHPERHRWMVKRSPEQVAYPAWISLSALALLAGRWRRLRWAPFAWLGILGIPLKRNGKFPSSTAVVADHIVGGASVLNETSRRVIGETAPVIFLPESQTPYLHHLADALTNADTPVMFWRSPTKSATLNILLGPMWVILMAWRGARIIHIHWTYEFSRKSSGLSGRFARWWFGIFLSAAHASGLKIVWTAHNILPHEAVFDDDIAARRALVAHADAVIALSPHSAHEVSELLGATKITVIPHGPLEIPPSSMGRDIVRSILKIGARPCFSFFGNVRPYKGLEILIAGAEILGPDVVVRISGKGDSDYVAKLSRLIDAANSAGADVQFEARWRSNEELGDFLAASDFCVFPFTSVDNSGSVLLALAAGRPVIIPDLASLSHIDNPGVLRFDATSPKHSLSHVMKAAANLSDNERMSIGCAAQKWALEFNWVTIAKETAEVYDQVVRGM